MTWLFGPVLCIKLSFFFVKQEFGVYVLYALSLDCFGIKLTEIGRSDPASYLAAAVGAVPTANICTVAWLFGKVLHILLRFFFVKQECSVYVLYALSLDFFGRKLTEIGRSDPACYLAAAVGAVLTANI